MFLLKTIQKDGTIQNKKTFFNELLKNLYVINNNINDYEKYEILDISDETNPEVLIKWENN